MKAGRLSIRRGYTPRLTRRALLYALLLLILPVRLYAQTDPSLEYRVKAVFLYNFTQFIEWPAEAFPGAASPLSIGVLGENPFGTFLKETVAGEKKATHPIQVQHYRDKKELKPCHILFVQAGTGVPLKEALAGVPKTGMLTVSDAPDFIQQGGMVRFYTVDGKIRFQINPDAAKEAGLLLSSRLLRLADLVIP